MNENILIPERDIWSAFEILNENQIDYLLLRNLDNELPGSLMSNKDIDIWVNPECKQKMEQVLKKHGWSRQIHPWDFGNNFIFLYSMDEFQMYRKNNLHIDVCFQLCCRSLNAGEWFPLDEAIQMSVFRDRRRVNDKPWIYQLSYENELLHLITRSIFDKKKFTTIYIKRIKYLMEKVDLNEFKKKIQLVFFKFTDTLIDLIQNDSFGEIRITYISFKNY